MRATPLKKLRARRFPRRDDRAPSLEQRQLLLIFHSRLDHTIAQLRHDAIAWLDLPCQADDLPRLSQHRYRVAAPQHRPGRERVELRLERIDQPHTALLIARDAAN